MLHLPSYKGYIFEHGKINLILKKISYLNSDCMQKLNFLWLLLSLLPIVAGAYYGGQNSLYQSTPIFTQGVNFYIKPFTLILIGISGILAYDFYIIRERISLNRVLKNFLISILAIFIVLYAFEAVWHVFMAFSLFIVNNGNVPIDKITRSGEMMPDIFQAKLFLFEVLWGFFALMSVKSMKETTSGKLIFLEKANQ